MFATKELLRFFCPRKPLQPHYIEPPLQNKSSFLTQNMSHNGFPAKLTCDWDYMSKQRKKVKKKQKNKEQKILVRLREKRRLEHQQHVIVTSLIMP